MGKNLHSNINAKYTDRGNGNQVLKREEKSEKKEEILNFNVFNGINIFYA
jgi:hypothetical protein